MISAAKRNGLRQALARRGTVEFPTGAQVRVEQRFVVKSAAGAIVTFLDTEEELARAYALAMRPLEPLRREVMPDPEADRRWGVDPPW